MNEQDLIQRSAQRLLDAATSGEACAPVRELIGDSEVLSAYEVQNINTAKRSASGAKKVGVKIGLTSEAVQKQLGVKQPDYGILFDDMAIEDGASIAWSELMQPKVEAEVAFVLGKDIVGMPPTEEEMRSAIDHAVVALEVVGSRVKDWNIKITDTIADNASASHFVLGSEKISLDKLDLPNCSMEMKKNGEVVSTGTGGACMGSPLNAALWLAITMAHLGEPLKKGDVILSGALGPMSDLKPGDKIETSISDMGSVSLTIEAE